MERRQKKRVFAIKSSKIQSIPDKTRNASIKRQKGNKPLTVLFIGDPHFKDDNELETQLLQAQTLRLIKLHGVDCVVVLGDTLDRHANVRTPQHARAICYLSEIHKLTELVVLIGNHDMRRQTSYMDGVHAFTGLRNWPRTHLVEKTLSFNIGHLKVVGVPYVEKGLFMNALKGVNHRDADLILAHQEFRGALTDEDGDAWAEESPLIVSGHIHDYGWLRPNILYTGAPMTIRHDEDPNKTVSMFFYEEKSTVPVEMRYNMGIPAKITHSMTVEELIQWEIPSYIKNTPPEHRRIRISILGTSEAISAFRKSGKSSYLIEQGIKLTDKPDFQTPDGVEYIKESLDNSDISQNEDMTFQTCLDVILSTNADKETLEMHKEVMQC